MDRESASSTDAASTSDSEYSGITGSEGSKQPSFLKENLGGNHFAGKFARLQSHQKAYFSVVFKTGNPDSVLVHGILEVFDGFTLLDASKRPVFSVPHQFYALQEIKEGRSILLNDIEVYIIEECSHFRKKSSSINYDPLDRRTDGVNFLLDKDKGVFLEGFLVQVLRDHQLQGVKFMYECVSNQRGKNIQGCILADAFGLGKTLQSISLLYTAMKEQSRIKPRVLHALIITPVTLMENWRQEIFKWLGRGTLPVSICKGTKQEVEGKIKKFASQQKRILIISYETFRVTSKSLRNCCDFVICDEGHRIKNHNSQICQRLNTLNTKKRVLLTGTPLQNNLDEFYTCASFVNPTIMGTRQCFNTQYAEIIEKAQAPGAPQALTELALARSKELVQLTAQFMLRRTGTVNEAILPQKNEYHIFVPILPLQKRLHSVLLEYRRVEDCGGYGRALMHLQYYRKILNHPDLVYGIAPGNEKSLSLWQELILQFPENYEDLERCSFSNKLKVVAALLASGIPLGDKFVLVSNFCDTLDMIENLLDTMKYQYLRIDGSVSVQDRNNIVHTFNDDNSQYKILLITSRTGGQGLNLVGGNRMVLYDGDWNPSIDQQATGRLWRDGQCKPVYIYRLFVSGSLDEQIYQRQYAKEELSSIVVDGREGIPKFTEAYLSQLFELSDICQSYQQGDQISGEHYEGSLLHNVRDLIELVVRKEEPQRETIIKCQEFSFGGEKASYKRQCCESGTGKCIKPGVFN